MALATLWAVFVISISVIVSINPNSPLSDYGEAWEGFLFGPQPLIYAYLIFYHLIPYLMDIHQSNKDEAESNF